MIEQPTINGLNINFKLKFSKLNESVKYRVIVTNNSKKDYEIANEIATMLRGLGANVWFDKKKLKPGDIFPDDIKDNIEVVITATDKEDNLSWSGYQREAEEGETGEPDCDREAEEGNR